jgi:hypothetical protein
LNENLKELKTIKVAYEIVAVEGFESHLYCLSSTREGNGQVCVYDENLDEIMKIGQQDDLTKPFYISYSFRKMRVCDLYFVFLDYEQVVFMNRQSGMVDKKINFDSFDFMLYGDGLDAFKYDGASCSLVIYDFDGCSQEFSLDKANLDAKIKKNMTLVDCVNGKLIFFYEDNGCLVF